MRPARVAIVDSGITPAHPHVGSVESEHRASESDPGKLIWTEGAEAAPDLIGHGTACAGAIRWHAPDARLVILRIFDEELTTEVSRLHAALERCLTLEVDLVNLSVGLLDASAAATLEPVCEELWARGTLVIAAAVESGPKTFPAAFRSVLPVLHDARLLGRDVGHVSAFQFAEGAAREVWIASPYPRPIPGRPPEQNFAGASFATAHVSGAAARVIQESGAVGADARLDAFVRALPDARCFPDDAAWRAARG